MTRVQTLLCCLAFALPLNSAFAGEIHAITLDSGKPGPTVVIIAPEGGAGSAGIDVVRQLQHRAPTTGRLVLAESVAKFSRLKALPKWETLHDFSELQKRFPEHRRLVLTESVDSWSYVQGAQGDTVQGKGAAADAMLKALRALPPVEGRNWTEIPPDGSDDTLVVTTNAKQNLEKDLRLALRQREFRAAANALLGHLGMTEGRPEGVVIFPQHSPGITRVAVFDDSGAMSSTGHGPAWLRANLSQRKDLLVEVVGGEEIRGGALARADVLLIGGGKSTPELNALGKDGREVVRDFVRNGGGYVGICAGAYLATLPVGKWNHLGLLPLNTSNTEADLNTPLAWENNPTSLARVEDARLNGGPRFIVPEGAKGIQVWARFTRNEKGEDKKYPLAGSPAVLSGTFGKGTVVLFSTHCERRPTPSALFPETVRWCGSRNDAASQQPKGE